MQERKALVALVTARVLHLRVKSVLLAWRDAVLGVREFIEYPVRKFWEVRVDFTRVRAVCSLQSFFVGTVRVFR